MSEASNARASSSLVRYGTPGALLLAALALSLLARSRTVEAKLGLLPTELALWLLPSVSVLVYLGVRISSGATDRQSDLLLSWVSVAPLMLHILHLLFALGAVGHLDRGLAIIAALLHLGLAGLLPGLPLGSPYGLRVRLTLGSERIWRQAHRWLGRGFGLAAAGAVLTLWLPPRADFVALLVGPALAVGMGFAGAFWGRGEDPAPDPRPSEEQNNPEDPESSP